MSRHFDTYAELQAAIDDGGFRFLAKFAPATFRCDACGQSKPLNCEGMGGTGYGVVVDHRNVRQMHCYECCGKAEREYLKANGRGMLYLVQRDGKDMLTDWPGTFAIPCAVTKGRHNMARVRYDVAFRMDGAEWYGTQYGDNTQVCHVRRRKGSV